VYVCQHESSATNAIQAMHGFELAGRRLKVGPANSGTGGGTGGMGGGGLMGSAVASLPTMGLGTSLGLGGASTGLGGNPGAALGLGLGGGAATGANATSFGSGAPAAPAPPAAAPADAPSRLLLLENLVGPDEVDAELESEIKDEVSKYGKVDAVRLEVTDTAVRVFVTCATTDDVANAVKNLHRRYFGGRVISARPIPMQ
jgi:splicing factor 45